MANSIEHKLGDQGRYSFKNDYCEGAHPNILKALMETNFLQQDGYGKDDYCQRAIDVLKNKLGNKNVDIHFVPGGTQANLIVISSMLRPYESVISASTGHINVHETGAIEATGHKVNVVASQDGKLTPEIIKPIIEEHKGEHMVKPKLVYISNTTEVGTVYNRKELEELYHFCKSNDLLLFMDGARLGAALCSKENDMTLSDISRLVDVFYIGGTKNGALLGEAIVINHEELKINFRYNMKQRGALLAKGRLLGLQFYELFRENLFFDLAKHANSMASKLSKGLEDLGYRFLTKPSSNQIFPILPNSIINGLSEKFIFYPWSSYDDEASVIRIVTSWATKEEEVDRFIENIKILVKSI